MGPFHPPPAAAKAKSGQTDGKAVVSLVLGLASMGCAGPFLGLPAIMIGALARRDIDRSNGALVGRAVAAGGIVAGLFGTGMGVVLGLTVMSAIVTPDSPEEAAETKNMVAATSDSPPPAAPAPAAPLPVPPGVRSYGSFEVIDLDDSRTLRTQLVEIGKRAHGRTLILQTYEKKSAACEAVTAALPDKRMQRALTNVVLVRVDVDEYDRELRLMHVETTSAPWFYKLDAKADTKGAISATSWETNGTENMAVALNRFVHPEPKRR
jgi:hypothetical protein